MQSLVALAAGVAAVLAGMVAFTLGLPRWHDRGRNLASAVDA